MAIDDNSKLPNLIKFCYDAACGTIIGCLPISHDNMIWRFAACGWVDLLQGMLKLCVHIFGCFTINDKGLFHIISQEATGITNIYGSFCEKDKF